MAALLFCEPTELYNILNQVTKLSRLTEANYLCLLDVRSKREYDESHVITALRVKKRLGSMGRSTSVRLCCPQKGDQYLIPESVDLECVRYCVVYDRNTSSMDLRLRVCDNDEDYKDKDGEEKKPEENHLVELLPGPAVMCGKILTNLTRQPVYILRGGYEHFSGQYHFFRTQKIFWMPQELDAFQPYPIEILPGKVFLGKLSQACDPKIHKDLKIKAHVNLSMESTPFFIDDQERLLHVKIEDSSNSSIFPFLRHICHFMEVHLRLRSTVLVFSTRGISRSSAAIVAFLMHRNTETLKRSWMYVKKCKNSMRPNRGLVAQLLEWEKIIIGDCLTDISDPMF